MGLPQSDRVEKMVWHAVLAKKEGTTGFGDIDLRKFTSVYSDPGLSSNSNH